MARLSITDYGADTLASSNSEEVAAAVSAASAGDEIYIPSGDFNCRQALAQGAAVIDKRLIWGGPGRLCMPNDEAMDGDPFGNSNATLYFTSGASGSYFQGLNLEGNKNGAGGPTEYVGFEQYEHHRGMFFNACTDMVLEDCTIRNYTGDAAQLYNSCENFVFRRCTFEWQQRDNITLSPFEDLTPVRNVLIEDCILRGASNQQIDNEHGCAHNVIARRNYLEYADNLLSIGLAIAGSGTDITAPSTYWEIYDNTIVGAIRFTWTSNSVIRNNTIINPRQISGIELERGQSGNLISGNTITCTQTAVNNLAGIYANGTTGGGSAGLSISGNTITLAKAQSFGIRLDGIHDASVSGNTLTGSGSAAAGYYGIRVRTTVNDRNCTLFVCAGNIVKDFGATGIGVLGNGAAPDAVVSVAKVYANSLSNTSPSGPMTTGIALNPDGLDVVQAALVTENTYGQGITTQLGTLPDGATMTYAFPNEASAAPRVASFTGEGFL
jgi:hypothetical protein